MNNRGRDLLKERKREREEEKKSFRIFLGSTNYIGADQPFACGSPPQQKNPCTWVGRGLVRRRSGSGIEGLSLFRPGSSRTSRRKRPKSNGQNLQNEPKQCRNFTPCVTDQSILSRHMPEKRSNPRSIYRINRIRLIYLDEKQCNNRYK